MIRNKQFVDVTNIDGIWVENSSLLHRLVEPKMRQYQTRLQSVECLTPIPVLREKREQNAFRAVYQRSLYITNLHNMVYIRDATFRFEKAMLKAIKINHHIDNDLSHAAPWWGATDSYVENWDFEMLDVFIEEHRQEIVPRVLQRVDRIAGQPAWNEMRGFEILPFEDGIKMRTLVNIEEARSVFIMEKMEELELFYLGENKNDDEVKLINSVKLECGLSRKDYFKLLVPGMYGQNLLSTTKTTKTHFLVKSIMDAHKMFVNYELDKERKQLKKAMTDAKKQHEMDETDADITEELWSLLNKEFREKCISFYTEIQKVFKCLVVFDRSPTCVIKMGGFFLQLVEVMIFLNCLEKMGLEREEVMPEEHVPLKFWRRDMWDWEKNEKDMVVGFLFETNVKEIKTMNPRDCAKTYEAKEKCNFCARVLMECSCTVLPKKILTPRPMVAHFDYEKKMNETTEAVYIDIEKADMNECVAPTLVVTTTTVSAAASSPSPFINRPLPLIPDQAFNIRKEKYQVQKDASSGMWEKIELGKSHYSNELGDRIEFIMDQQEKNFLKRTSTPIPTKDGGSSVEDQEFKRSCSTEPIEFVAQPTLDLTCNEVLDDTPPGSPKPSGSPKNDDFVSSDEDIPMLEPPLYKPPSPPPPENPRV
jgi:hypothetical protein